MNIMADTKKTDECEEHEIGLCVHCGKMIYSSQKFEVLTYDVPTQWEPHYKTGPVHVWCRVPLLKRFVKDLIKDISTLTWFIEGVMKTPKPCIPKEEPVTKIKKAKKRR